jgi:hypothetical protein
MSTALSQCIVITELMITSLKVETPSSDVDTFEVRVVAL